MKKTSPCPDCHVWRLRGSRSKLHALAALLEAAHRLPCILTEPHGSKQLILEHYTPHPAHASWLRDQFGGSVHFLPATAWVGSGRFLLKISRTLWVASNPETIQQKPKHVQLLHIPAGMAFGTGDHPTTALCARQLAALPRKPLRMLDVGTGTGILAFIGAIHGYQVTAIDNDPDSIREAAANAKRNPSVPPIAWKRQSLSQLKGKPYQLITANLYAELLANHFSKLHAMLAPGGTMILSGIYHDLELPLLQAIQPTSCHLKKRLRKGKWLCLVLEKPHNNTHRGG